MIDFFTYNPILVLGRKVTHVPSGDVGYVTEIRMKYPDEYKCFVQPTTLHKTMYGKWVPVKDLTLVDEDVKEIRPYFPTNGDA